MLLGRLLEDFFPSPGNVDFGACEIASEPWKPAESGVDSVVPFAANA